MEVCGFLGLYQKHICERIKYTFLCIKFKPKNELIMFTLMLLLNHNKQSSYLSSFAALVRSTATPKAAKNLSASHVDTKSKINGFIIYSNNLTKKKFHYLNDSNSLLTQTK